MIFESYYQSWRDIFRFKNTTLSNSDKIISTTFILIVNTFKIKLKVETKSMYFLWSFIRVFYRQILEFFIGKCRNFIKKRGGNALFYI